MEIFRYLPQLLVAYDGNDKLSNLVHVKKSNVSTTYYCPCCGGTVKPQNNIKEQSYYLHMSEQCSKENQLYFFCRHWLFKKGNKFYINDDLFEVNDIQIEKEWDTPFGKYRPNITVYTTSDKVIYFEIFFSHNKTDNNYFCKWDYLKNDVIDVDIEQYINKTDIDSIQSFKYLYHNGICYSKTYKKTDLYANTIAKVKHELMLQQSLNYKARIEQLDLFWQTISNNESKTNILNIFSVMQYEDMIICYELIKKIHSVSFLKNDVLNIINNKVISGVREKLLLPSDENVYFDLKHIVGNIYEAGIRLKIKTAHINYDDFYIKCDKYTFLKLNQYPKIIFSKQMYDAREINISDDEIENLKNIFYKTLDYKNQILNFEDILKEYEKNNFKIQITNNLCTVLFESYTSKYELLFENRYIDNLSLESLKEMIDYYTKIMCNKLFIKKISSNELYNNMLISFNQNELFNGRIDIKYDHNNNETPYLYLSLYIDNLCVYNQILNPCIKDFFKKIKECENEYNVFLDKYNVILSLVKQINECKNNVWKAKLLFDSTNGLVIKIDQKITRTKHPSFEKIYIGNYQESDIENITNSVKKAMNCIIDNLENIGIRLIEVAKKIE